MTWVFCSVQPKSFGYKDKSFRFELSCVQELRHTTPNNCWLWLRCCRKMWTAMEIDFTRDCFVMLGNKLNWHFINKLTVIRLYTYTQLLNFSIFTFWDLKKKTFSIFTVLLLLLALTQKPKTRIIIYHKIMQWHGRRQKAADMIIISLEMWKYYDNCILLINHPQKLPSFNFLKSMKNTFSTAIYMSVRRKRSCPGFGVAILC